VIRLWKKYSEAVSRNCSGTGEQLNGLPYWRNKLFAAVMTCLLPLSILAVVPGIIMSIVGGIPVLAVFDALIVFVIAFIALFPGLRVSLRKTLFIILLYLTASMLLYFLGSFGPGLLYLLSCTIFVVLIFPSRVAYLAIAVNTLICAAFGAAVYFDLVDHSLLPHYSLGSWIAISSNVLILSAVMAMLIPMLFNGLQKTIEAQQKLQQQLEQSLEVVKYKNSELEQFAYIASHDLQEPLRSISGLIHLLKQRYGERADDREIMAHVLSSAERMRALVTGLLEYARIGTAKQIAEVDCNKIVADVLDDLRAALDESGAKISLNEKLPVLKGYPDELKQLFQNLILNANKFRRKNVQPEITIGVIAGEKSPVFYVRDNGIGIPAEYKEKIFVIFKRLHTRSQYEGTGIGLAYCRKIIELHGGKIWVESEEDKGSTFYFTIPERTPHEA